MEGLDLSETQDNGEWKQWTKLYNATFAKSEIRGQVEDEIESYKTEQIAKFVSIKIENLIRRGYRSTHKGREIVEAVQEKKDKLLSETILEISERLIKEIFIKLKQKEEEKSLSFEDFIYIIESGSNRKVEVDKNVLFLENRGVHVSRREFSMMASMAEEKYSSGAKSGIDMITQCFFLETSGSTDEIREDVIIPSVEKVIKLKI